MLNLDEVEKDIIALKRMDTSFAACERLAWLVLVRDELKRDKKAMKTPLDVTGESEFLQAVDGKDSTAVWAIMDDLMDTIKATAPKVYDSVMAKIKEI